MTEFSSRSGYGLSACFELALNYNNGPIRIRTIAQKHAIPQNYLEQLLVILKKNKIVKSYRGVKGGYKLNKEPSNIKIYEILECLEGHFNIFGNRYLTKDLQFYNNKLKKQFKELFDKSLEDLIQDYIEQKKSYIYHI